MPNQLIVFDLGGVIVPRRHTLRELTTILIHHVNEQARTPHGSPGPGTRESTQVPSIITDPFSFEQAYRRYRESYSLSMGPRDYFTALIRAAGISPTPELIADLQEADTRLCSTAGDAESQLLNHLHAIGQPYAIFSNAPLPIGRAVEAQTWSQQALVTSFSPMLRFTKPHQGAFRRFEQAVSAAGMSREDIIYFDDRQDNVDTALTRGWQAHLWRGVRRAHEVIAPSVGMREVL